ncbi:RagB/SusD family nutrient uptake outer membrane protein [Labilibaculum euxinus]|uniref:RagB/SusD family nutrient uptake outer membrane protein n=1 Tax=Labilibaculum euxinus TaxID=2686357 RepID=A0A7M4D967_9BACT|nr:RagB/SusD family nutrient uptake outer membrane protein [Labilibaculum euxinus]MUP39196.1 RagB/SusD family nutrient uptake outer membrane protein [Labilibaculum euxinus]MVB08401.1 RagB/SusD family nutrient uptake outer membrane protein [Labilibaculum euxinus]
MKIKYFKSTIIVALLFFAISCDNDILDKAPVSSFSGEGFYLTTSDAQAGIYGIYNSTQGVFRTNFAYWGEGRADNVKTEQSGEGLTLIQNNLNESASSANWSSLYTMISRANYAVKYIPNVYGEGDPAGNQLIGQARALRALAYFYLVKVWGDVPLITEPYTSIEQDIFVTKTNKEAVLDQIEEDLVYAVNNCTEKYNNNNDRIMINKGSANALLTKVYMWRHKYTEALATSAVVLKNPLYSLVSTMDEWGKIFTDGYSKESIFEVGYNDDQTNSLRVLYAIGSYAIFTPSEKFKASYETGDLRISYVYDTTIAEPKAIWKFLGKGVSDEDASKSHQNIVLIRLADIMLLRAEALNQLGGAANKAEALSLLNTIRIRAGLPAFETEETASTQYGNLESAILHERSIELCFEGQRWFDLVRTGRAISTMNPLNGLSEESNLVWPISTTVLNKNPNMEQNDYYK